MEKCVYCEGQFNGVIDHDYVPGTGWVCDATCLRPEDFIPQPTQWIEEKLNIMRGGEKDENYRQSKRDDSRGGND